MTCQICGGESRVLKTMDSRGLVIRKRICGLCGTRWTTEEKMAKGSLVATKGQGVLTLISGSGSSPLADSESDAGARERRTYKYSEHFDRCWESYGRGEEKQAAYAEWKKAAATTGGEVTLCRLVLSALEWQAATWASEGWKFAPYFRRYLKYRRWEDDRKGAETGAPRRAAARAQGYAAPQVRASEDYSKGAPGRST
jgi:hypothetical protein